MNWFKAIILAALLPIASFGQGIGAPSGYQRVLADTLSDTALFLVQVPPYLNGASIKLRSMTATQLSAAVGGGGGGGAAISDSLAAHGLGADSSAWFKSVNRVFSVGPEWGDSTPGAQVGIQAAVDSACSTGGTVYVPAGKYLFDQGVILSKCRNVRLSLSPAAEITMQTSGWVPFDVNSGFTFSAPFAPSKSPIVLDSSTNILVEGGIIDGKDIVHETATRAVGVLPYGTDGFTIQNMTVKNFNPSVSGQDTFSIWSENGLRVRYQLVAPFNSQNGVIRNNFGRNAKYDAFSALISSQDILFINNNVKVAFENYQAAAGGNTQYPFRISFVNNVGGEYRQHCLVTHGRSISFYANVCGAATNSGGINPVDISGFLAIDGADITAIGNTFHNATSNSSFTTARGAMSVRNVSRVFMADNVITWDSSSGQQYSKGYSFHDSNADITIQGGSVTGAGYCFHEGVDTTISKNRNVEISGVKCKKYLTNGFYGRAWRGFVMQNNTFEADSTSPTLSAGANITVGIDASQANGLIQNNTFKSQFSPVLASNTGRSLRVINNPGYNAIKTGSWWTFAARANPNQPAQTASPAVQMLDSLVCFSQDTTSSGRSCVTKTGTRKIGSVADSASYPAIIATHIPTVTSWTGTDVNTLALTEAVETASGAAGTLTLTCSGPRRFVDVIDVARVASALNTLSFTTSGCSLNGGAGEPAMASAGSAVRFYYNGSVWTTVSTF